MSSQNLSPIIDQAVLDLRPDFRCLSINVSGFDWTTGLPAETDNFIQSAAQSTTEPDAERDAHIASWNEAFVAFGAKPKRTPCSAAALVKRTARDGTLPRINPLVDLYNAVSVSHGIPIGGEDRDLYVGMPRLIRALGTEDFEVMKEGVPQVEHPDVGEVIWMDDIGVTCRRWNWRQGIRTRIEPGATNLWFLLEALDGLSDSRLERAGTEMAHHLRQISPNAEIAVDRVPR